MFEVVSRLVSRLRGKPAEPKDSVFEALTDRKGAHCPDCGGLDFFMGPQGGMSRNIKCANEHCGSEFNCAPFDEGWCGTPMLAERISSPQPDRTLT